MNRERLMAFITTRLKRAQCWRTICSLTAATLTITAFQLSCAAGAMAQVKAPAKNHLRPPLKPAASTEEVQPFSIGTDGSVTQQLLNLQIDPADAQAASDAVGKALGQPEVKAASSGRAVLESQGDGKPKRLVSLQLFSAKSLAVELQRDGEGKFGYKLAPGATEDDDQRVSTLPGTASATGTGARAVVPGSVSTVKANSATLASSLARTGANAASLK